MKIYLDNNLGVTNVEQEELTQDTIGYNILKVYIPNAVLTPYDTFTCYYGALLQNGRKVGWFAMEARTSSDTDYEANYTLYKATLEQCVVSVEGKVYIGCQVLLGNSGNATLIKKNTAVVQFNVRKSVAINNDILVLDTDQTTTDVLESYKNLLENALTTYATKATTYTKTEVDSALALKADKSDTYTKTEVDGKFDLKADKTTAITHTGNQLQDYSGNNIYPVLDDGSVYIPMIEPKLRNFLLDNCYKDELTHTTTIGSFINKYTHQVETYSDCVLLVADVSNVSCVMVTSYLFGNLESYSFWDENDTYITGSSVVLSSGQSTDVLVTIPSNAKYIKVSSKRTSANYDIKYYTLEPKIASDSLAILNPYFKYINLDITFTLGFVTNGGVINTDLSYFFNTKVECKYRDKIKYSTKANGSGVFAITYYDENDTFISQEGRNAGVVTDVEVTIPYENCTYVRISTSDRSLTSVSKFVFDYTNEYTDTTLKEVEFNSTYKTAINQKLGVVNNGKVIITVDDGMQTDVTYIFPLITTYNIPIVFGCWSTSYIIQNNLSDLLTYISDYGCEIAQHTSGTLKDQTIKDSYTYLKTQKDIFSNLGIDIKNYIYGYNQYDDNLMFVASSLYDYACAGGGLLNTASFKKYALNRKWITWGDLNSFKNNIDMVKNNGDLLIIGIHSSELADADTYQKLKDIIEYAQTNNVEITTLSGIDDLSAKNGTKITDYVNNAINDLRWELGSHTLDVENDSDVAFSMSVPSGAIGCQINKVGGMSYKVNDIIRDSAVTSVVSKGSNDTTIDTIEIPSQIQNLTGYGWGIDNTCYNYIDFDRKVFVQKGHKMVVDENTGYTYISSTYKGATIRTTAPYKAPTTSFKCIWYGNDNIASINYESGGHLYITFTNAYASGNELKNAMLGVIIVYELATPIETDISAYLTTDTIDVEPNGTLEFTNTYNNDVPSDIDYLIEEVKA